MHLLDPVAQRVHDELQRLRVRRGERVAAAGRVPVMARRLRDEPVVAAVVEALQRERRAEVVALAGVVVDDVEDHLDARRVQRLHHLAELGDLLAAAPAGVLLLRGEEAERRVAPVVREPLRAEEGVVEVLVDREQLDRGHAEPLEVRDRGRGAEACVRAAQLGRHLGMTRGEALHVHLVDEAPVQRGARRAVVAPVEAVSEHDRLRDRRGAVAVVEGEVLLRRAVPIGEDRAVEIDLARDRAGVRIDEQLRAVVAQPRLRLVRAVGAITVKRPRADARDERVPHVTVPLAEPDTPHLACRIVGVEQAEVDRVRVACVHREVGAVLAAGRAEGRGGSGPGTVAVRRHWGARSSRALQSCAPPASAAIGRRDDRWGRSRIRSAVGGVHHHHSRPPLPPRRARAAYASSCVTRPCRGRAAVRRARCSRASRT